MGIFALAAVRRCCSPSRSILGWCCRNLWLGICWTQHWKYLPGTGGSHLIRCDHRDQEDHGSKPAPANSSQDPISKIHNIKIAAGRVAQVVDCLPGNLERPWVQTSISQKEREKNRKSSRWSYNETKDMLSCFRDANTGV
jgi:hypothetical protein